MMDHHETTPHTKHSVTTQEEPFRSPQHIHPSAFDNLLTWDEAFYRKESKSLAVIAAQMRVPRSDIEDVVQEVWVRVIKYQVEFTGAESLPQLHCLLRKVIHDTVVDLFRHFDSCPCQSLSDEVFQLRDEMAAKRAEVVELHEW